AKCSAALIENSIQYLNASRAYCSFVKMLIASWLRQASDAGREVQPQHLPPRRQPVSILWQEDGNNRAVTRSLRADKISHIEGFGVQFLYVNGRNVRDGLDQEELDEGVREAKLYGGERQYEND